MKRTLGRALLAVAAGLAAAPTGATAAESVYAVTTDEELTSFSSDAPTRVAPLKRITGLQSGEDIEGIDVRPRTGAIYALGSTGRLYTLDPVTARATVAATVTPAPSGSDFAVDFNPVPDRLRIVSDTGQNLRVDVDTGVALVDGAINPAGAKVAAAGYENSFAGAATTRLLDIDSASDKLRIQTPPNNGTLVDVGALGVDASGDTSLDIAPSDNTPYAAIRPEGGTRSTLCTLNSTTGAATAVGEIGGGKVITGIAIARQSVRVFGVTTANALVSFPSTDPANVSTAGTITGLQAGENVLGIDVRPATGQLFALGSTGRIYRVNTTTAAATAVSATPLTLTGTRFGVDFNPVPDRLRITSDAEQNLRANPEDGTAATDGALNPGDPTVVASAYLNPFGGATATTLFNIDQSTSPDQLTRQDPPNNGTQVAIGPLGAGIDDAATVGFDIAAQDNAALAAIGGVLYRVSLASGAATPAGPIGGTTVSAISAADAGSVGLSAATYTVSENAGTADVTLVRDGGEGTLTVGYATGDDSAKAGTDFTASSGAVTFAPGERLKTIEVPVTDNAADQSDRAFTLTLSRGAGGYRLGTTQASVNIADDDAPAAPAAAAPGTAPVFVPVPFVARDTAAPIALVIGQDRKLATVRSKGVNILYSVNEAATLTMTLKLGSATVGTATTSLKSAGIGRLNVKLSSAGKKAVGSSKSRRLSITATVTDLAKNAATTRSAFTAKR